MTTLRDAEAKINKLERELAELKFSLRNKEQNNPAPVSTQITRVVNQNVDSELTADSGTVLHKLLHLFDRMKVRNLEVEQDADIGENLFVGQDATIGENIKAKYADIRGDSVTAQIHASDTDVDEGFYLINEGAVTFLVTGATKEGSDWVAKNTGAIILVINPVSGFFIFANTGLTPGNTYTPTHRFTVGHTGTIDLTVLLAIAEGGTGAGNAGDARTNLDVYSKAEVDSAIAAAVAGKADVGVYVLTIDGIGNHSHAGAVIADAAHTHTGTVTL